LGLGSGDEAEEMQNDGNTSPSRIANSLEHIKQARTKKGNSKRKQSEGEETEAKPKRKRLSKKKQEEQPEEERGEEDYEGMGAMPDREDGVLLFEDSDGGEAQE